MTPPEQSYSGPEMTSDEFYALRRRIADWLRIKAQFDPQWTRPDVRSPQQMLTQLAADVEHSSLLMRMVQERKEPLAEPPPLDHAYPVYPD
jgi:hypothetical protein